MVRPSICIRFKELSKFLPVVSLARAMQTPKPETVRTIKHGGIGRFVLRIKWTLFQYVFIATFIGLGFPVPNALLVEKLPKVESSRYAIRCALGKGSRYSRPRRR